MSMFRKTGIFFFLLVWPALLVFVAHPILFGNPVDWYSQHVVIGKTLRDTMIASHSLAPDFVPQLFGGTNFYALSYYGALRPDIVFSSLFAQIDFVSILSTYAVFLMGLGSISAYVFLKQNRFSGPVCLVLSLMLPCSTIFFQSHRQIMFVSYIPILFGMLTGIDHMIEKKKCTLFILCGTFVVLHSFYFAPASFLGCILYFTYKKGWKTHWKPFLFGFAFIIAITAMLWLPTGLYLLENKRPSAPVDLFSLFRPDRKLTGLLYGRYGCGQPLLAWISLVFSLFLKKTRKLAMILLVLFLFPVCWYVLSGFLYARTKALLPMLPLVVLLEASTLKNLKKDAALFLVPVALLWPLLAIRNSIVWWDAGICLLVMLIGTDQRKTIPLLLVPALMIWHAQNPSDSYLDSLPETGEMTAWTRAHPGTTLALMNQNDLVNETFGLQAYRASGYSSIYPARYNTYIFDMLKNNIPINNRTAILDSLNPFYLWTRSIDTVRSEKIPYGYKKESGTLSHNGSVLPRFWVTYDWMSEKEMDSLSFPDSLQAVVETPSVSGAERSASPFTSRWRKENLPSLDQAVTKRKKVSYDDLHLDPERIYVLEMDIENTTPDQPVVIDVCGMRNKLSSTSSVYYNHNTHFTYFLSGEMTSVPLTADFRSGSYVVKNTVWHSIDARLFEQRLRHIQPVTVRETSSRWTIEASLEKDGILCTPFAMQNGFSIEVDGRKVPVERINQTFAGCALSKGNHTIEIRFEAPGKKAGIILSVSGLAGCVLWIRRKRK